MITKETCGLLRKDLEKALGPIAEKYGCSFELGSITYNPGQSMHMKVTFNQAINPSKVGEVDKTSKFRKGLVDSGRIYDVSLEDLKIVNIETNSRFIGLATSRPKYPYAFLERDGKITLYTRLGFMNIRNNYRKLLENKSKLEVL